MVKKFFKIKNIIFKHQEGLQFLGEIQNDSIDLILTDPPYITSRQSGMDKWVKHVEAQDQENAQNIKTEEEWSNYKTDEEWEVWLKKGKTPEKNIEKKLQELKNNFIKYGSVYGKKYAVKTDYGSWDSEFTMKKLDLFIKHFYRILRPGGTCIVFFDLWKLSHLKNQLETAKFKQLRFIEWVKTNPQPINSQVNYLTNCREIALLGVKGGKPTFNSSYDKGIYEYPIYGGKDRFHPTQKSLPLFENLILKHSNEGDKILDCFFGSGTTAVAALKTNRKFVGCELNEHFYNESIKRVRTYSEKIGNHFKKENI